MSVLAKKHFIEKPDKRMLPFKNLQINDKDWHGI